MGCEVDGIFEPDTGRYGGKEAQAQHAKNRNLGVSVQLNVPEQRDGHKSSDPVCKDIDRSCGI